MVSFGIKKRVEKIKYLINLIKDSVFPKFCIYCGKEGCLICNRCKEKLNPEVILACPECRQKNNNGNTCKGCNSSLDRHIALFNYKDERIKKLIREFKYEYMTQILRSLRPLLAEFLDNYNYLFSEAVIVPVPLHKKRKAKRGFNQAKMIGSILSEELEFPQVLALRRVKNTLQQTKLEREERLKNVDDAFKMNRKIEADKVILVDDVFTTGATLQECGRQIRQNSEVDDIIGFTLARGY